MGGLIVCWWVVGFIALVKRRLYKTIYSEDVREGSFVILKVYHLAQGERLDGNGIITWVIFFLPCVGSWGWGVLWGLMRVLQLYCD